LILENLLHLRVENIVSETPDTKTFYFKNTENQRIDYTAGQFLTLIFDLNGHSVRRSYSLSSSPDVDDLLSITVKRIANGEVSRHLHDHIQVGDVLQSLPPTGRFILKKSRSQKPQHYFFIAAGSGIVPIFSIIKSLLETNPTAYITLIYQTTNTKNAIFYDKIIENTEGGINLKTHFFFSQPTEEHAIPQHLTKDILQNIVHTELKTQRSQAAFFLCGPNLFMRIAEMSLHFMGFTNRQIHREDFVIPLFQTSDTLRDFGKQSQVTIHLKQKTQVIAVPFGTTILDAALAAHIPLPYSCKGGVCTTCLCHVTKGKVVMPQNQKLFDDEILRGLAMSCIAYSDTEEVEIKVY
jgi:ring-1,2-phenylacetyl-CoA epoxidase subunit PaaE